MKIAIATTTKNGTTTTTETRKITAAQYQETFDIVWEQGSAGCMIAIAFDEQGHLVEVNMYNDRFSVTRISLKESVLLKAGFYDGPDYVTAGFPDGNWDDEALAKWLRMIANVIK